jgi:hypothetical protein
MVKVSFRYTAELVNWIKETGGSRWSPAEKTWDVPESVLEGLKAKALELGVDLKVSSPVGAEGAARAPMRSIPPIEYQSRPFGRAAGNEPEQQLEAPPQLREGDIRLRRSKDGRFVIVSMTLIANTEDIKQLLAGSKTSVRFRVLPPRPPQPAGGQQQTS